MRPSKGGLLLSMAAAGGLLSILWRMLSYPAEYAVPPAGHVVLLTHKDLPSLRQAANDLASYGQYVLVGVSSAEMIPHFAETAVKGVETMIVDVQEPSHIAHVVYRSGEIARDLHRPLLGVIMLYPGKMTSESNLHGLTYPIADGSFYSDDFDTNVTRSMERALDIRLVDTSLRRALISPLRLLSGAIPLLLETEHYDGRVIIVQPDGFRIK